MSQKCIFLWSIGKAYRTLSHIQLRQWIALISGLVLLYLNSVSFADQNDPRLDKLFNQLQTVDDQKLGSDITDEIWRVWRESPDESVNELMLAGIDAMSKRQLRKAVRIFDEVIYRSPDFAEGWNKRATVYFFMGEYKKSVDDVRRTLTLEPRHFGAAAGLGLIFLSLNYYEKALGAFEKALDINPHLPGPKIQIQRLKKILGKDNDTSEPNL